MSRTLISLLFPAFLALAAGPTIAQGAGDPVPEVGAVEFLAQGHRKLADGNESGARADLVEAVRQLRGAGRSEDLLSALVSLAQLDEAADRPRQALDWWLQSLLPADALAHAPNSTNTDIGVVVRVQIGALLLAAGDASGSERMGWDAVSEALALARPDAVPVGVLTILRVAAAEGADGVRERVVELDELLSGMDGYRLHSLPRPLPLPFMAHDVARQYAEAALLGKAEAAFATAARTYLALDAPDLAARALVDLARAAMELGALDRADRAVTDARDADLDAALDGGVAAIEAELLVRRGRAGEAAGRFLSLARSSEGAARALYLGRTARLVGIASPGESAELHREAAEVLRTHGAGGEALVETVFAAFQLARAGLRKPASDLLGDLDRALAAEGAPRLPSDVMARFEAARAMVYRQSGEAGLARTALAAAGSLLFQRGDTDAVAGATAMYVDVALDGEDAAAVDAALAAVSAMEESLGLRVDGWRGLAAQATVAATRGEAEAAHRLWAEAARRVEASAADHEPAREAALFGTPADRVYGPWLESLLGTAQHDAAFVVVQRWRGWQRASITSMEDPEGLRGQASAVREALRVISTRATKEDPATLREPLLEELGRLRAALRSPVSCGADDVRAALPKGAGLVDGVSLASGDWMFVVDDAGLEVRMLPPSGTLPRRDATAKRIGRWSTLVQSGSADWSAARVRQVGMACDLLQTWSALDASRVHTPKVLLPTGATPDAGPDAVSQALGVAPTTVDLAGAVWVASRPPSAEEVLGLRAAGASAVVYSPDLDAERFRALLAAGKSLDVAITAATPRRPRNAPDPTVIWGPLP